MRFRYTLLYRPYGLSLPPGQRTLVLQVPAEIGLSATLTLDVDPLVNELDRYFAIANRLLGVLVGAAPGKTIDEQVVEVQKGRSKYGAGNFLVVTGYGDFPWEPSSNSREQDGIVVDLDGPGRAPLRELLIPSIKALMCTLFLAAPNLGTIELISDAGVFLADDGRTVFQYNPQMNARAHVGHVVSEGMNTDILGIGRALVLEDQLQRVSALIADSLANDNDPLRAFLTSWSALEIFINKMFPRYEAAFAADLSAAHPAVGHQHYLARVREVMAGSVRLADKFAVIAAALTPDTEATDSATFKRLLRLRNDLTHGTLSIDTILPHTEPALLARRLLLAHLQTTAPHGA
jgi:hypothetical protein